MSATMHFAHILDSTNPEERHGAWPGWGGLYFLQDLNLSPLCDPFFHAYRKIFQVQD